MSKHDSPFTRFAHSCNLEHALDSEKISEIESLSKDINGISTAFFWTGEVLDLDSAQKSSWLQVNDNLLGHVVTHLSDVVALGLFRKITIN